MKNYLPLLLITSTMLGCSSAPTEDDAEIYSYFTGGQSAGDSTSFYWSTQRLDLPYSAADYVVSGDYGWHQSDYRWRDGGVREIVREGTQRSSEELVPYSVHLRFNKDGEAVYQQYRLDGKVLPLAPKQIELLLNEALSIQATTRKQNNQGLSLMQGYWDGETFTTCNGREYDQLEFNQTLPSFVINRLASLDNYAAFIGSNTLGKITVTDLLMLEDDGFDCVIRPELIEEE